jgi:ATP/maltotriose-dependent transcriptional regulator MalT
VQSDGLGGDDLERLAVAAYLTGHDEESARAWEQAHHARARAGDHDGAVRCAAWLAIGLLLRGEMARAAGWLGRAGTMLEEHGDTGSAGGYLMVPKFLELIGSSPVDALVVADAIIDLARRYDDRDLITFGLLCRGEARLALGETARALQLFDEIMVAVAAGEVTPIPAGIIYCAVIEACMGTFDFRRAAEWVDALDDWCATQPDLVPYRGQCLIHRSQVLQAQGEWDEAIAHVRQAAARLTESKHPALGLALYQHGELLRLQGDHAGAEQAYRAASEHGHEPAPGFALLRLAEGRVDAAVATITRMRDENIGHFNRPAVLAAFVEIVLASGDTDAAQPAVDQLAELAWASGVALPDAMASYATGTLRLAQGEPAAALRSLRHACAIYRDLSMPYEVARTREQIGKACRAVGDHDTAEVELDIARGAYEGLGARSDFARLEIHEPARTRPAGLTERECEVLRLVATGQSNRAIASTLLISEHTVGRHLQNIFTKIGVSSRAAATTFAHEHGLV